MKLIYYIKSQSKIDIYDANEDMIPGIDSEIIKLPRILLEKIDIHVSL
jgi:hypothetical protein